MKRCRGCSEPVENPEMVLSIVMTVVGSPVLLADSWDEAMQVIQALMALFSRFLDGSIMLRHNVSLLRSSLRA